MTAAAVSESVMMPVGDRNGIGTGIGIHIHIHIDRLWIAYLSHTNE
jgi:hypothetical protein